MFKKQILQFLWILGLFTTVPNLLLSQCTSNTSERKDPSTGTPGWQGEDNTSPSFSYPITNANLKGQGASLYIAMVTNNANPSNASNAVMTVSYSSSTSVSYAATFTIGTGYPTTLTTSTSNNGVNLTMTTGSIGPSTAIITLPASIPNNGTLKIGFSLGSGGSGDFNISAISFLGCSVGFKGNVWNDGLGATDNLVNKSGTSAQSIPSGLYVNLFNKDNNAIVSSSSVSTSDGSYSFYSAGSFTQPSAGYALVLSTSNSSITAAVPSSWSIVTQGTSTTAATNPSSGMASSGNTGSVGYSYPSGTASDQNTYYGIDSKPTTTSVSKTISPNNFTLTNITGYKGILSSNPQAALLAGTDPEDGALGSGSNMTINTIGTNTRLYYNGNLLAAGNSITNYDPTKLGIYGTLTTSQVTFTYSVLDKAGIASANPATYTINTTGSLPVIYSKELTGTLLNDHTVNLAWETTTEINADYFLIQKQVEGSSLWTDLLKVTAQSKTNKDSKGYSYSINDNDFSGITTLYRLKQYDLDGAAAVSRSISIDGIGKNSSAILLYPNPTVTQVTISNILLGDQIRIMDFAGRVLVTYNANSNSMTIPLNRYPSGNYLAAIVRNGKLLQSIQFLKK